MERVGRTQVESPGRFAEHRAAIVKDIMRSSVGSNGVIDVENRLELGVEEIFLGVGWGGGDNKCDNCLRPLHFKALFILMLILKIHYKLVQDFCLG